MALSNHKHTIFHLRFFDFIWSKKCEESAYKRLLYKKKKEE